MTDSNRTRRLTWVFALVATLVTLDQTTKAIAIRTLRVRPPIIFAGDVFRFQYAENTGAFLGLGSALPDGLRFGFFTALNVIILSGVAVYLVLRPKISARIALALTLILAGGIGNIIDRVMRDGRVVDFMNLGLGSLRTGIFNVADLAIVAGLGLMVLHEILHVRNAPEATEPPPK